jgi:hypothetical protein
MLGAVTPEKLGIGDRDHLKSQTLLLNLQ